MLRTQIILNPKSQKTNSKKNQNSSRLESEPWNLDFVFWNLIISLQMDTCRNSLMQYPYHVLHFLTDRQQHEPAI